MHPYRVNFGVIGLPIYVCEMPYQSAGLRDATCYFGPTIIYVSSRNAHFVTF